MFSRLDLEDYEHGFIKVTGGKIRDEPLDNSKVVDKSQLTDVDPRMLWRSLAWNRSIQELEAPDWWAESRLFQKQHTHLEESLV